MLLDQFDQLLDDEILAAIADAERLAQPHTSRDLPIYDVLRYHLGLVNERFEPERSDTGKRIRPRLCVLACEATGEDGGQAIHAAAAIELLHNFTLIHDDIQDQSPLRRHRRTIWNLWGAAQAINAGDAMFALSHLALNRSMLSGISPETTLELSTVLHQTTLRIVEGQVLDLGFEQRDDVTVEDYLNMIGGKTAAICRSACWSGARIAGASRERQALLAEFGYAVGVGFQLRDDVLGIWGATEATGKAPADDIRRRKKSLPVIMLRERASAEDRATLDAIYRQMEVPPQDIETVLDLLRRYGVERDAQEQVQEWHDRAAQLLHDAVGPSDARAALEEMVDALAARTG